MARKTIKDYVGSVNVNADITPVTRLPIEQVDASLWPEMTINELTDQRTVLMERMQKAGAYGGNTSIVDQMQRGILQLELLIRQKSLEIDTDDVTLR